MFDITLRGWKDGLVDPISRGVPRSITPGQITLAAFVCGTMSCLLATTPGYGNAALIFWLLNRFLDCLDGSLARATNSATQLGGFLDLLSDFIIYSLLPIAIARGQSQFIPIDWTALALLEASFHVNNFVLFYIAAVAADKKDGELTSVTMKPGLIEGFESGTLFTMMLIWPARISIWSWLMAVGVAFGTAQRVWTLIPVLKRLDFATKSE
jgi:phosphatidylglycerophosphate synthase